MPVYLPKEEPMMEGFVPTGKVAQRLQLNCGLLTVESAPSSDDAGKAIFKYLTGWRNTSWLDLVTQSCRFCKFDESNVIPKTRTFQKVAG